MTPADPRHGTYAGTVAHWGIGETPCDPCTVAGRRYTKTRKLELHTTGQPRLISILGYRRRIQALCAIGWNLREIAEEVGIPFSALTKRLYQAEWVSRENHTHMVEVYERLCMTPRTGPAVTRTLRCAERKGYAPPLAWDDIDNDEMPQGCIQGQRDLLDEYRHLTGLGESHDQAIRQLGVTEHAIEKALLRQKRTAA